jgi:hypothetical protein
MAKYVPKAERERKKKRAAVEQSLRDQLKTQGKDTAYLLSKVDQYMLCWDNVEALSEDITKRGRVIEELNTKGAMVKKPNPSITARQKELQIMAAIEKDLRLNEPQKERNTEDDYL